jgi:hypothetical protein
MRRFVFAAAAALACFAPGLAAAVARGDECTEQAVAVERERDMPSGLLHAIALAESGQDGKPHPYALRIGRRSFYPASELEALKLLRGKRGHLDRKANVGCMQLSLAGYGWAFAPPERILDPGANMRMAAEYLVDWKETTGSWSAAVARFQGGRPRAKQAYVCRIWNYLRVLHPDSAAAIEGRGCAHIARPRIDPETIAFADRLREQAAIR